MRKRNLVYKIILLSLFSLCTACSGLSPNHLKPLTRHEVEGLSKKMSGEIESKYKVIKHRLINSYVDSIGQAMVAHTEKMPPLLYRFKVLKSNEINIFSLPDGTIYVTLELLRNMKFEGQFAAALAHELSHHHGGHYLIKWRRILRGQARDQKEFKQTRSSKLLDSYFSPAGYFHLDRSTEKEADQLSLILLYNAGFDPRVAITYINLLQNQERLYPRKLARMNAIHPPLKDRLSWVTNQLSRIPPPSSKNLTGKTFKEIQRRLLRASRVKK